MNQPILRLDGAVPIPNASGWTAEVADLAWMEAHAAAWDRLVARALAPAPFFSRAVVCAHARNGIGSAGLRFLVVRRDRELALALPFHPERAWFGLGRRIPAAWTTPYVTNGTPLVAAGAMPEALDGLLDGLANASPRRFWLLPLVSLGHPVLLALEEAIRRRGWRSHVLSSFERPVVQRRASYDAYAQAHLAPGRRKSLRRQRRRLTERGPLTVRSATEGDALLRAVEDFLALEAAGWKGARKTALASRAETAAFARELFGGAGQGGVTPRADVLSLDGRPIAVSLALVCGDTAHLLKTAYDETLRACAPGLILEDEIVRACHATAFVDRLDTASIAGSVLDELYTDRERMGDLLIATDARITFGTFEKVVQQETARRAAVERLKRFVKMLVRRS